jgi:amino acid adenylation domain-containing protein
MTIAEFLSHLNSLDVKLWAEGDQLRCNAPKGVLTPALQTELENRKGEILLLLKSVDGKGGSGGGPIVSLSRGGHLPLSFAQQRLWFLRQLEPDGTAYNIAQVYQLVGPLNITALEQSLNEIVQRHETLRTTFSMRNGEPVQAIAPTLPSTLSVIDFCDLPVSEKEIEVQRLINQEQQWRFDLTQGSLLRATLLRLDQTEHVLCVVIHHIIIDGWSLGIFFHELSALYDTFSVGKVPSLPKLPIQYADFAVWQRKQLTGKRLEQQLAYWKRELANLPVLALPTDRPRPPIQTHRGAKQSFTLSQSLSESVKSLTQQEGVTPFTTLLAAFTVLLHRYTGQVDIVVGSPIANRTQIEIEGLIGYFMNMLILRADLLGNPSFRELLGRIRKLALEAYDYQDMPLDERLVKDLQRERDLSRNPFFQIAFVFLNVPTRQPLQLSGLTVTSMKVYSKTAQVDLSLYMWESAEGLEGLFEYNTDLFDNTTIASMITHFQTLLASIVADPNQRLADLPTLMVTQAIEDTYPLSPMQQGMFFHTLQAAQSGVYIEQMVLSLHEDLNVKAFVKSWQQITERHPILRTSFHEQGLLQPLQFVHKQVRLPLKQHDWRHLSTVEQEERLQAYLQTDRKTEFDLTEPPLMRLALFRLAETDYRCIWTFHHILMDGRSFTIVLKEVFSCYQAFCQNQCWSSPIPRPYRDFIDWLSQQPVEATKDFWQELLKGFTSPTFLPTAYLENVEQGYGEQKIQLSATVSLALTTLAQHHQLTLNTLVQGAWAILLSHYNGENDIVFGCTRAGRNTIEKAESMVGLFINTLPIRVQLSPEVPLIDWLKVLRTQWIELRNYEHTPLIKIQEWSGVSPGTPLFNTILVFENYTLNTTLRAQGGKWLQREFYLFERTNYPLTASCYADSEILLAIEYDLTRFDHKTVSRILEQLKNLLTGMAMGGIEQPLIDLPLLSAAERHQLLVEWNDTHRDIPQNLCIHQLFEAQAERTPETIAVVFEGEQVTYRELNRRANQLAHHLQASGIEPESVVGLCVERSLEMIIGLLGILKAGGAYLPLDPNNPRERLACLLADSYASVLLTQDRLLDNFPKYDGKLICLDTDWPIIAQESITIPDSDVTADNLAYIIYTSGSTGKPKGVMVEHRALVNFTEAGRIEYAITSNDRVLQFASISFDASAEEIYLSLTQGATLVLRTDEMLSSATTFWQNCSDLGLTVLDLPTAYWHQLASEMVTVEPKFPKLLRLVIIGGEKAQHELLVTWLKYAPHTIRLINTYGPTEATVVATMCDLLAEAAFQSIPIGHPISNVEVYVLNQQLQPVSIGAPCELYLGGFGLARGYPNHPDLTAEKFIPHPFANIPGARLYRTGDLARYRPDGTIEFLGRKDHQVKLRGFRIELGEIEAVLRRHTAVREAVVLCREDNPGEKQLVAYVVSSQETLTTSALRSTVKQTLPAHMIPSAFVALEVFPLLPNGKVDRRSLPAPEDADRTQRMAYVTPRTPIEETVATIWQDVLGLEQVGVHDNFFELGGHSLLATQVVSRVREELQVELKLTTFFEVPTVEQLAQGIEGLLWMRTGQSLENFASKGSNEEGIL